MQEDKIDRRVQRTRQLLHQAMMSLIVEKGYDAITVQNIIDRANVGRSTFYTHYQDKEDLFVSGMGHIVRALIMQVESPYPVDEEVEKGGRLLYTVPLFQHTQEQYRLYKAMVGGRGVDIMITGIHQHLSDHIQAQLAQRRPDPLSVPVHIIAHYLAGALLTLLTWWLDHEMPYPPERMDEMFQQLTLPGVQAVLEASST